MNQDRWQKVKRLFDAVIELAPVERERFLDESCATDDRLRREVENLLDSFDEAESFMETPAAREVASVIIKVEPKNLEAGRCFGHYEIIKQIGAGGMGEVYLARDKKLDRRVAVKILNEKFSRHESNLGRFTQEAKAASALNHPNILVIHEIGESENANYIVSEFVEGETLREHFIGSPLKLSEVLDFAVQIANALSAAHAAKIVHRDIKPENIMVRPDGYVKILDFGLAKLVEQKVVGFEDATVKQNETAKGVILGTVNYMSPEQAKGERVDERTDIFSFGVLVYEMMAGRTPFAGNTMSETFANLINQEPQPLTRYAEGVPDELQRIVAKTLKKNKDERYQTMKGLLADLKGLQKRLEFEAEFGKFGIPSSGGNRNEQDTKILEDSATAKPGLVSGGTPNTKSIAVLPFSILGLSADDEYLGLGLADALITQLSRTKQLTVRPTSAVRQYAEKPSNTAAIGRDLRVGSILEGSLQRADERLRVTVQLVNVEAETPLWAEKFDARFTDIFDVQDEIASQVAAALLLNLNSTEQEQLKSRWTENVEAYQLYLKARFYLAKSEPDALPKAIALFRETIALAPDAALAYAGLAESYIFASYLIAPHESLPKAREAAQKAIELDSQSAEAHVALGGVKWTYDWDWRGAEREFELALALNPNYTMTYRHYGMFLVGVRRFEEAFRIFKKGLQFDPLSSSLNAYFGLAYVCANKPELAIEQCRKTLELDPNFLPALGFLSQAYWAKGDFENAVETSLRQCEIQRAPITLSNLAHAYACNGQTAEARKLLAELEAAQHDFPLYAALVYLGLNEREKMWNCLEQAFAGRVVLLPGWLNSDPRFQVLCDEPRFQELLRRIDLPSDETAQDESINTAGKAKTTGANTSLDDARLNAPAKAITDSTAQSQTSELTVAGSGKERKHIFVSGLVIFLIVAIGFGYYFLSERKSALSAGDKKSLAVLPSGKILSRTRGTNNIRQS